MEMSNNKIWLQYSVSQTHEVHLGGHEPSQSQTTKLQSDRRTSKRSQNFKAIAELQSDRGTSRRSQNFKGIESEIVDEEKNFCERNPKILSTINPEKLRVGLEGL